MTAAAARAAHLIVDNPPLIFADTVASAILGAQAEELISYHRHNGSHVVLSSARAAVVTRSRFTEDRLAQAVRRGVGQYVILGAGLDTFAYRTELNVKVFEVDHPKTQEWKRTLLTNAAIPEKATYVPVDFEADSLIDNLIHNGFAPAEPALVSWLGVTMYLTQEAISHTLAQIAQCAPGTEIILDYMLPAELRDTRGQTYVDMVAPVAAEHGEPWLTFFRPHDMTALLAHHGFETVSNVNQHESVNEELWNRSDALAFSVLSMIAYARLL
jgi:methyltransferase (TIGR00027 family)